jgi:hypothetical protein
MATHFFDRLSQVVAARPREQGAILTGLLGLFADGQARAQPPPQPKGCNVRPCMTTALASVRATLDSCMTWCKGQTELGLLVAACGDCIQTAAQSAAAATDKCHTAGCGAGNHCSGRLPPPPSPGTATINTTFCCPKGQVYSATQRRCTPCPITGCVSPLVPDVDYCTCI